ncbi:E3 ubiquitin-protein ligase RGLG1-like isoform X2 [Phoenix dactylifera]|uniref:E3 ubiquitin-protein ligase RGLG1-like isoform X2 n=1 Tax=Phoenix dactylifera TaxID=42345 RepID=A0A8B8ZWZ2_PHODC|nr:E3 ubiquitin-protein ligase RGLG1-like isoform X2 [Phoenix dactylifera]
MSHVSDLSGSNNGKENNETSKMDDAVQAMDGDSSASFLSCHENVTYSKHQEVFSFYPENRPCNGFEEALQRYKELVPHLRLAGPTSFAPIIETTTGIVDNSGGQYHVLLIIADGQVSYLRCFSFQFFVVIFPIRRFLFYAIKSTNLR